MEKTKVTENVVETKVEEANVPAEKPAETAVVATPVIPKRVKVAMWIRDHKNGVITGLMTALGIGLGAVGGVAVTRGVMQGKIGEAYSDGYADGVESMTPTENVDVSDIGTGVES